MKRFMYKIADKKDLAAGVFQYVVEAPDSNEEFILNHNGWAA